MLTAQLSSLSIFPLQTTLLHIFQLAVCLLVDEWGCSSSLHLSWAFVNFLMFFDWRLIGKPATIYWSWVGICNWWHWLVFGSVDVCCGGFWPVIDLGCTTMDSDLKCGVWGCVLWTLKNQLLSCPLGWWVTLGSKNAGCLTYPEDTRGRFSSVESARKAWNNQHTVQEVWNFELSLSAWLHTTWVCL